MVALLPPSRPPVPTFLSRHDEKLSQCRRLLQPTAHRKRIGTPLHIDDLTWLFWTKLCEKLSLERSFGYAEEEVQR